MFSVPSWCWKPAWAGFVDAPGVFSAGHLDVGTALTRVPDGYPLHIGADVTVGHGAMLHGCSVGDRVLVGMDNLKKTHNSLESTHKINNRTK